MELNPNPALGLAQPASPAAAGAETFCLYLAKQLIAKRGFVPRVPEQAREIAAQSDHVLFFSDGYSPTSSA